MEAAGVAREIQIGRHEANLTRLAQCQDAAKVALEMGNSPAIVFAHYRKLVKPKAAGAYWGIMPGAKAGNVVAFAEAAA